MGHSLYWRLHSGFFQGIILGAYIQGIKTANGVYAGGGLDWLTPFSVFTGISVIVLYATLGCGWLIFKTDADLQNRMYQLMPKMIIALFIIFWLRSIYAFGSGNSDDGSVNQLALYHSGFVYLAYACKQRTQSFILWWFWLYRFSLMALLFHPSPWDACSIFTLVLLLLIILIYTALSYWVFRDKVRVGDKGYH